MYGSLQISVTDAKKKQKIGIHATKNENQWFPVRSQIGVTFTTKAGHIVVIERLILYTYKYKNQFLDLYLTNKSKQSILRPTRPSTSTKQ